VASLAARVASIFRRRKILKVEAVFTPTTQADANFVPRPRLSSDFRSLLATPGKQGIVYGESKSGKTSLIKHELRFAGRVAVNTRCVVGMTFDDVLTSAFDELDAFAITGATHNLSATDKAEFSAGLAGVKASAGTSVTTQDGTTSGRYVAPQVTAQRLAKLLGIADRIWVIEDFHKLAEVERTRLAQALKVFSDMAADYPLLRVLVTGATDSARDVVALDGEMHTRVSEVPVAMLDHKQLKEILRGGENLLNVDFVEIESQILSLSAGLSTSCHQLALSACRSAGVLETQKETKRITAADLQVAIEQYIRDTSDTLKSRFEAALHRQRVRTYDNTEFILAALAFGSPEGMLRSEILSEIRRHAPNYPSSNLTNYLRELVEEEDRVASSARRRRESTGSPSPSFRPMRKRFCTSIPTTSIRS